MWSYRAMGKAPLEGSGVLDVQVLRVTKYIQGGLSAYQQVLAIVIC